MTELIIAVENNNIDLVKLLISNPKIDPNLKVILKLFIL